MSPETEHGFGTGLRAQLRLKQGESEAQVSVEEAPVEHREHEQVPVVVQATVPELTAVRTELEQALVREQQLRDALHHQIEAHERELAASRDLALREAEADQLSERISAREERIAEQERVLAERLDEVASERRDLNLRRTELVAEEARLAELGVHVDARAADLQSVDHDHAQASSELAKQLASIAERERELKRERTAQEERRAEAEARLATREQALRSQDEAVRVREEAAGARERDLLTAEAEAERVRTKLQERVEAVASREADTDARLAARESVVADREAALGAWEERVRANADRVDRERAGHGRASQEAFSLLAELEQREETIRVREVELNRRQAQDEAEAPTVKARDQVLATGEAQLALLRDQVEKRETKTTQMETALRERMTEIEQSEQELRLQEARLGADLELREEKLVQLAEELEERESRLADREQDLAAYVGELQRTVA